ncbi:bifunctional diaminohydroxyphosphoribosylaminopyrimidine deaminase/5-amino-6-(5-phosphoribosylamino)uracil reductase RibD [Rhodoferax sp. U11-2br]|uniref:bifunctional diaminohydroxyphosphoribosylaminopyrimidine deaminase/5-amino-6-(5-phosphoribosylamino)uracil reductase RibD n=1 Tax=Rhodoferax sp. U11-2br TaxID=2838878 RepID=UPI001BEBDA71|nr:bifunctional diaminohydroxyphosphoribosylaminopyrimidine deaminase/5-amino-6-(5-phosphoribosylamino)uracil reductase RibD [Rhodoferax sp. U11-2br]MBT3066085.1 bifunctional diaminohydroxyphosphoribosylaminopyrimidine deaminase/5-amino-6-(5-phosphoribosylamino)uracil reductase RibD [Rhodoferax sp. U11-2br]
MPTLNLALRLAHTALLLTSPNPRVGCVITGPDGQILGQGHTQQAGGPHAEIMALRDAAAQGHSVQGATAYVTLEPCAHQGRTGPCCDALIAAGIAKLVATNTDPNPLVAGQGFARMRAAGIEVVVLPPDDPLAVQSRELNIGFFSRMVRKTPWVRVKIAASLDGKTALSNGVSQWITSPEARADGHAWRARACAVLTGMGTVRADNPRLDVRLVDTPRQPAVGLVDSRLELPQDAHLFVAGRPFYIWATGQNDHKVQALEARGARVFQQPGGHNQIDLAAMLQDMGRLEINELHVEAGHRLNGALMEAGLVDEFLIYLAPKLLGQGRDMASFGPLTELSQALPLVFQSTQMVGPDLRVLGRVQGRDVF